jgi:tetratricopeptide (TPR) repeat protein
VEAHSGLAQLLVLSGRKGEAVSSILQLVRQGVETDMLFLLALQDTVINDRPALDAARKADPNDANSLVGLAWRASRAERVDEALGLLREAVQRQPDLAFPHVALGRLLLDQRRFDELAECLKSLPADADLVGEVWFLRAQLCVHEGQVREAVRCYWEGLKRSPESKVATFHLAGLLSEVGATGEAARFVERVRLLQESEAVQHRVLYSRDQSRIDPLLELIRSYEQVGRVWEAFGWCQVAVRMDDTNIEAQRRLRELQSQVDGMPLQLVADLANTALSVDLSQFPLPSVRTTTVTPRDMPNGAAAKSTLSFREDSTQSGLQFRYFSGTEGPPSRRMFEFTGGGVGVLDYDVDGFSDVYFTQGCHWPIGSQKEAHTDRLFANRTGQSFRDVTEKAGLVEAGFGQGVTVGDFNSDGFPDLYAANIGGNCLWSNNGDGTFSNVTELAGVAADEWTTSCVMADLNGDAFPDIYAVNYVTAPDVFDRVCRHGDGSPKLCMPYDFEATIDRLWLNDGDGRFTDATQSVCTTAPKGMGLGVVAWDVDGSGRLSLLVANDTTPNLFLTNDSPGEGPFRLNERGIETGLALNGDGKATGCMGVAMGDVDDDGRIDLFITNFFDEPNTLYTNSVPGFFEDRSRSAGLYSPSLNKLGFGTQFLDSDLDGRLELFVANGHVDDLRRAGRPYRMSPQLFGPVGRSFVEIEATSLGPYFQSERLGRAVARLDWNRDGQDDLIVGHLEDPCALLTNTTPDAGRFLSLKLFGTASSRDAIGTIVRATIGGRTLTRQLTAGDGYQASNERRIIIGTEAAAAIDRLTVRWPSGREQTFDDVASSQEAILVEGQSLQRVALE